MRVALLAAALLMAPLAATLPAHAVEVRVSAPALQRTLEHQLFNQPGPDGKPDRHYLRGNGSKGCSVYSDEPHVSFREVPGEDARIVVTVKTHFKVGFGKGCFGLSLSAESQVSFIPEAEGETVGFRDARIEHITNNKELDVLLEPFLKNRLPEQMKVNAASLLRTLLVKAPDATGYTLTLTTLNLRSMHVADNALLVDLEADIEVD